LERSQRIEFPNGRGESLAGSLELPADDPEAYALFAHCFTCSKNINAATWVSRALRARGYAVLRFDFTGLGGSEGDFANENFTSNIDDLVAAADHLRGAGHAPSLLVGHSLGGAAVLAAGERIPEVRAVATIGAPSDPGHVSHLFAGDRDRIEAEGSAEVRLGGRSFRISRQFLEDVEERRLAPHLAALDAAVLVCHSPEDEVVPIDHAGRIYKAARHPKSFFSLSGTDHLLSRRDDAVWVADLLAVWAGRYVTRHRPSRAGEA